jgi:hypothetical protein
VILETPAFPALIEPSEARCFSDIVRRTYSGDGVVVDAGCFVGASTAALCDGLPEGHSTRSVIAIDRFVAEDHYLVGELARFGHDVRFGESFLPAFIERIGRQINLIELRAGDVTQVGRISRPIEVLMIDLAKSPQLQAYCLLTWLPKLVPGHSVLIQQDLHSPFQPWVASAMGQLLDFFDPLVAKSGESAIFRCRGIPSAETIRRATTFHPGDARCLAGIDALQHALRPSDTSSLDLSRALLMWSAGHQATAKQLVREVLSRPEPGDVKWRKWATKIFTAVHASDSEAFTSLLAIGAGFASL